MSEPDAGDVFGALVGEPDPEFANELLDHLRREMATSPGRPSNETNTADDQSPAGPSEEPQTETELIMLKPNPRANRPVNTWILSVAAVLVVAVGAVVLLTRSNEDPVLVVVADEPEPVAITVPDTVEIEPVPNAESSSGPSVNERLAFSFIQARAAFDGDAVRALVADDAVISPDSEWVRSADGYLLLDDWERATGMSFLEPECLDGSTGRVRCTYTMETTLSRALDLGVYSNNSFIFTIADGKIQQVNHTRNHQNSNLATGYYSSAYFQHFTPWVGSNYPGDTVLMFNSGDDGVFNSDAPFITPESIALWEAHVEEFVNSLLEAT